METDEKILVIDDNADLREIINHSLVQEGFKVLQSGDAISGIDSAKNDKPDLIILDVMLPEMDGFQVCALLKGKRETADIPIIFLSARDQVDDKIKGLNLGGVDYIAKPFKAEELIARIKSLLRSRSHDISLNPLSKLPGNKIIEEKLFELIKSGQKYAVGYLDIDNFKSYNDKHGFFQGDEVLLDISQILNNTIVEFGNSGDFVGHIGGDDFIFITTPDKINNICEVIIERFEDNKKNYYSKQDFKTGHIQTVNRLGVESKIPLMTISIAVVTNRIKDIDHPAELATIASEVKSYLKTFSGSNYKVDQRSDDSPSRDEVFKKKKIMIIEQNSKIINKFDLVFAEKNVSIRYVENGASALLIMESMRPDLILMNSHLPLIDGLTLFGQIKKNKEFAGVPVFIYSNLPFDRLVTKGEVDIPQENFLDMNNLESCVQRIIEDF